jgi:uncharacterized protein
MISKTGSQLLRIFISEKDRAGGEPLYATVLNLARDDGIDGATVLRGLAGFGTSADIHSAKVLQLSEDLPLVIEIVDSPEKIEALLPKLKDVVGDKLMTLEEVSVVE